MTTRQKKIVEIINSFNEGWMTEEDLENKLGKLFTDKRHESRKKI